MIKCDGDVFASENETVPFGCLGELSSKSHRGGRWTRDEGIYVFFSLSLSLSQPGGGELDRGKGGPRNKMLHGDREYRARVTRLGTRLSTQVSRAGSWPFLR